MDKEARNIKLLPIGTVVEVNQTPLLVIGYTVGDIKTGAVIGYRAFPYPTGLIAMEKILFIPWNADFCVLAEGWQDDFSQEMLASFTKHLERVHNAPDQKAIFLEQYKKILELVERGLEK